MTAADQVAVTGRLPDGAVVAIHYSGGASRATNFRWEINGTDGDLVATGPTGNLDLIPVPLRGARGDEPLADREVPAEYHRVPGLEPAAPGYAVAHAYAQLLDQVDSGTALVPDFEHAVLRHRMLEAIVPDGGWPLYWVAVDTLLSFTPSLDG